MESENKYFMMDNMTSAEKNTLLCPACDQVFAAPKILPCRHRLCGACALSRQEKGELDCPRCHTSCRAESLQADFRLEQFIDLMRDAIKERQTPGKFMRDVIRELQAPGKFMRDVIRVADDR